MSIYFNKYQPILELKRRLGEGEEEDLEEKDKTTDDDDTTDYNMNEETPDDPFEGEEDTEDGDNVNTDTPTDDEPQDEEDPDTGDDTEGDNPTDYSMDDTEGDEEPIDDEPQDEEDPDATDTGDTTSTDFTQDEIKQMEQELFKSIPSDQMKIKKLELQRQYLEVYETINNIIERANKIERSSENVNTLKFLLNKLIEFKGLVKDYMNKTFDTKSYIENNINYQEYLVTLNTINKILKEMKEKDNK